MTLPCTEPLITSAFVLGAGSIVQLTDGLLYFLFFGLGFGRPLVLLPICGYALSTSVYQLVDKESWLVNSHIRYSACAYRCVWHLGRGYPQSIKYVCSCALQVNLYSHCTFAFVHFVWYIKSDNEVNNWNIVAFTMKHKPRKRYRFNVRKRRWHEF